VRPGSSSSVLSKGLSRRLPHVKRKLYRLLFISTLLCTVEFALRALAQTAPNLPSTTLLMCGGAEVVEARLVVDQGRHRLQETWHWRPEESAGLPTKMMRKFVTTDDCKTVSGGKEVLITSSGDAVALVSHETGATLFYAEVKNAHSADLLPEGLIAVASSNDPLKQGDRILLFDRRTSEAPVFELPLEAAHGVVWDRKRQVLWALGGASILKLRIDRSGPKPTLVTENKLSLPAREGHDLQLAADCSSLYITNTKAVFKLDPDRLEFSSFEPFRGRGEIKSLSIQPDTGQIAYTQADPGVWWTYTVHFIGPEYEISLPSMIYKVRWAAH